MRQTKRKRLIVANWKMNPLYLSDARLILAPIKRAARGQRGVEVVICPPAIFLTDLISRSEGSGLKFGGQDVFFEVAGAHTGELSPLMFRHIGAEYVIIGHSERRQRGENDGIINKKIKAATRAGLKVIFCVGEAERDGAGDYLKFLTEQLTAGLQGLPRPAAEKIVLAYEPLWAIGRSAAEADSPAHFLEQAIYLRKIFSTIFGRELAMSLPIIYGGSVEVKNAADFLTNGEAAGLLIGHESLRGDRLAEIIKLAAGF